MSILMLQDLYEWAVTPWVVALAAGAATVIAIWVLNRPRKCTSKADLAGKTAIVTGANTGIGFTTALDFAARNARVILACRSKERGEKAREEIVAATGNQNVVVRALDLASMASVRQFAQETLKEEDRLDILVNNAGVLGVLQKRTEDGLEVNMASNHFGHFLLTSLLLDLLKKSAPSRIVNVSSEVHRMAKKEAFDLELDNVSAEKPVPRFTKYASTKLANLLFTRELARRLAGTGVSTFCIHPGMVKTEFMRNMPLALNILLVQLLRPFYRTSEEGAQTTIYCAVMEGIEDLSGKYFVNCSLADNKVNPMANDTELSQKLWKISEELTGLS